MPARASGGADVVPISLRLAKHRRFTPGPFRLGWMQVPCNLAAISWIAVMTVRASPCACPRLVLLAVLVPFLVSPVLSSPRDI